jgi:hypothetical protein
VTVLSYALAVYLAIGITLTAVTALYVCLARRIQTDPTAALDDRSAAAELLHETRTFPALALYSALVLVWPYSVAALVAHRRNR